MNESDLYNARKWLNIGEKAAGRAAKRAGINIGRTIGNAGGAFRAGANGEAKPSDDGDGAEKGDGSGDASKPFQTGNKMDRISGLYDCETGEEVTIDGVGEEGSEAYPTGFQDCKAKGKPTMEELIGVDIYYAQYKVGRESTVVMSNYSLDRSVFNSYKAKVVPDLMAEMVGGYTYNIEDRGTGNPNVENKALIRQQGTGWVYVTQRVAELTISQSAAYKQNYINNYQNNWPAPDRNHLTWNKEKNCFEPLCPELNNQVAEKYKECKDEMILCDEDGNQVKVKAGDYGIEVTQAKYGQKSFIKNGKVQSVTKLTQAQTDDEFK